VEDASDEGGFTVVYVADEDDAQPVWGGRWESVGGHDSTEGVCC
jgi:hypothetical protein